MRWTGSPLLLALALSVSAPLPAATYDWVPGLDVVGTDRYVRTTKQDTLLDVARRQGFGYDELRMANPDVDPWIPGAGTTILLPGRHVLPAEPREGIVINLDEMRLYYFPAPEGAVARKPAALSTRTVITHPISVGRDGLGTPEGTTTIEAKILNPTWYPGEEVRREHAERGDILPRSVPPGPDNPLGPHAMKLGLPGILIHGTNKPYGIGMPATHGCIRLYPEDIEALMPQVPRGTTVRIQRQAWKTGWRNGVLYFETHAPAAADPLQDLAALEQAVAVALIGRPDYVVDWVAAEAALMRPRGVPQPLWPQMATGG